MLRLLFQFFHFFIFMGTYTPVSPPMRLARAQSTGSMPFGANVDTENSTDFGLIMAGAALAAVPIIIIFLIFQKYFTKGIAMGAVKG